MLWNECPIILRDVLIKEQAARNAIGGLAAIAEMKKRLATQPPIIACGDRVSSSATVSRQAQPRKVKATGEGQGPEIHVVEEDSPANSHLENCLKCCSG
ncbi:hypothetical protein AHAS_Ahas01G0181800 [Arachis hypogaea]